MMMRYRGLYALLIVTALDISAIAANKQLDKNTAQKIIEQYESALRKVQYPIPPKELYFDENAESFMNRKRRSSSDGARDKGVERVSFRKLEGLNVFITISYYDREVFVGGHKEERVKEDYEGYVQFTHAGKIKYDPVFVLHPVELAYSLTRTLVSNHNLQAILLEKKKPNESQLKQTQDAWRVTYEYITKTGIPLFGLRGDSLATEQRANIEQLLYWFNDGAESWDIDQPLIPIAENRLKEIRKEIKKIKLEKVR